MKRVVALGGAGIGVEAVEATCDLLVAAGFPVEVLTPPPSRGCRGEGPRRPAPRRDQAPLPSSARPRGVRRARGLLLALALCAPAGALAAEAPAPAPRTVGVLSLHSREAVAPFVAALRQGLGERGYVEGRSIVVLERYAERRAERLAELAAELARLKVDVIVTGGDPAVGAVRQVTSTIPVVLGLDGGDPVGLGFVASLARPGGRLTGVAAVSILLNLQRLELLRQVAPRLARVGVIVNARHPLRERMVAELEVAAYRLGLSLRFSEVAGADGLERALPALAKERVEALLVASDQTFFEQRARVVEAAARSRLPALYPEQEFVEAGGLMAYSADLVEQFRRSAGLVDRILKGANPGDIPVEQPAKMELAINVGTAERLGLRIPRALLARADRVIR